MKLLSLPIYATVLFISVLPCNTQANNADDFALKLKVEEKNEEVYYFSLRLKYVGKKHRTLYVQTPTDFGKTSLLTTYKGKEVKSISTTTYSPISYSGIILNSEIEHEFKLKFIANKDGGIYCNEIDQKLSLFEKKPKIAARCILFISDFDSKRCMIIEVKSNYVTIDFDHKVTSFPPPPIEPFDYSKLPPL